MPRLTLARPSSVRMGPLTLLALTLLLSQPGIAAGPAHGAISQAAHETEQAERNGEAVAHPVQSPDSAHAPATPAQPDSGHTQNAQPAPESTAKAMGRQIREALQAGGFKQRQLTVVVDSNETAPPPSPKRAAAKAHFQRASAKAHGRPAPAARSAAPAPKVAAAPHEIHWSYEGEGGPQNWARLKPAYATCGNGQRQSPINIDEGETLKGPAQAIEFNYTPSRGTVVNNGHTVMVNVYGGNSLTVRGMSYHLVQFHFHHPSEERINQQSYPMVGHFVHRNDLGQLAVLAVLFESGDANSLIEGVWTHMPLDVNDSVRTPPDLIDVNAVLPRDRRYYQFIGSLTTPPCTEGVLWLVLKQPVTLSAAQLRLFSQLYPNNARPVQPVNGRPVRDAVVLSGEAPAGTPAPAQ